MVILYSSLRFGFFDYQSGSLRSSIMPQKKNPDIFELVRSKSGLCTGNLMSMLTVLKSLPSGYDKDLQADKELIFSSYDCANTALEILCGALDTLKIQPQRIATSIDSFLFATDIADYLVKKGIPSAMRIESSARPFRIAKEKQIPLDKFSYSEWKEMDDVIEPDIIKIFNPKTVFQETVSRRYLKICRVAAIDIGKRDSKTRVVKRKIGLEPIFLCWGRIRTSTYEFRVRCPAV